MKPHDDPTRAEQTAAMLDHLLAHYETFTEGRKPGQVPEPFMRELHELYYYRVGILDAPTAWQAPLPPVEADPGDTWYDRHIGPRWWWLTDRMHWRRLRSRLIFHGLIWYGRLLCAVSRLQLAAVRGRIAWRRIYRIDPRPAAVLLLALLWPLLWTLAHR